MTSLTIREDDLTDEKSQALVMLHINGMYASTPFDHVHVLDLSDLRRPDVTIWSAWQGGDVVGIGALKQLDDLTGEVKSMRTHPAYLRRGVATSLLEHIIAEARYRNLSRLSLETGVGPAFEGALALYRKRGFVSGEPFADYRATAYNQFFHLDLASAAPSRPTQSR